MIFYFSGTGNSAWVARRLADGLGEQAFSIAGAEESPALQKGERVGFVFPVHAWGPPRLVLQFISRLQMERPSYLYFVCTCGDDTGHTAQVFERAIRRKGWKCQAGYSVTMPNTYVSLPGFDVDSKEVAAQKVRRAVARVDFICEELSRRASTAPFDCHEGTLPFTKTYVLRPFFHAFLMSPKPFHATDDCIGCDRCAKACPVHNISMSDHRPCWGADCTHCLACYHACPKHAVRYGKMTDAKGQYGGPLCDQV